MRASRQDYGSGHFLPGREPFWNRAGLFDFDPWRRGPLATNGSRQDADRTAGTALPPREPWNFDIPAIDHGFRTVAACHPGDQAPRVPSKELFPLAGIGGVPFNDDYRTRPRIVLILGRPLDNYILPQIAAPADLTAVIEIQNGRICGQGIRAH